MKHSLHSFLVFVLCFCCCCLLVSWYFTVHCSISQKYLEHEEIVVTTADGISCCYLVTWSGVVFLITPNLFPPPSPYKKIGANAFQAIRNDSAFTVIKSFVINHCTIIFILTFFFWCFFLFPVIRLTLVMLGHHLQWLSIRTPGLHPGGPGLILRMIMFIYQAQARPCGYETYFLLCGLEFSHILWQLDQMSFTISLGWPKPCE